ncbi:hypothetical protein LCGC14_1951120 [marine sediment metagenome]|uniref:Uncharacterized protein n=1 Tax=marine sediment metagenome TaxID=412755 RepID=A0A0F9HVY4_9ZZZZ
MSDTEKSAERLHPEPWAEYKDGVVAIHFYKKGGNFDKPELWGTTLSHCFKVDSPAVGEAIVQRINSDNGMTDIADDALDSLASAAQEIERLKAWVNDLQAGMYINCVYCGHRYGPDDEVPESMADVLKEHVEQCPEHPMSKVKKDCERLEGAVQMAINAIEGGEKMSSGISRQQFGIGFVNMLKESLKGGYRDSAMDLLKKHIEWQEEAREKNEALVQGLERVIQQCEEGDFSQVDWRSTIARIAKEAINPDG